MPPRTLALFLLLAACAKPPPAATDWGPLPPLAHAALAEWHAWGDVERQGWPAAPPADTAATPARFERLLGYWSVVPGGAGVVAALRRQRAGLLAPPLVAPGGPDAAPQLATAPEPMSIYGQPFWSAAFISAVARAAEIPRADLPSAASHARYIDAALARALADPAGAAFRPEDPEHFAPRPGDLLCADRRQEAPYEHWQARLADKGHGCPLHCDVVVRAGPGEVAAIGGNVDDLVVLRRLPADPAGRVLPAPPGESRFFLILAARR